MYFFNIYQVPQEDILYPLDGVTLDESEKAPFPLHRGICLRSDNNFEELVDNLTKLKALHKR